MPSPDSHRNAAPSPAASTYGDVPASNFHGSAFQRDSKKSTARDHVAAAEERRHLLEQLAAGVQHADAGRPVDLVAGEAVEVGAERLHVDAQVRRGLRAVDQHHRARRVRPADDRIDRVDRAEHVGDVRYCKQFRPGGELGLEDVQVELEIPSHRHVAQLGAHLLAQELPRHDVRVVLHLGDEHAVARRTLRRPTSRRRG